MRRREEECREESQIKQCQMVGRGERGRADEVTGPARVKNRLDLMLPTFILRRESKGRSQKSYLIYQQTLSLHPRPTVFISSLISIHLAATGPAMLENAPVHTSMIKHSSGSRTKPLQIQIKTCHAPKKQ